MQRNDNRSQNQLRPISLECDVYGYADASVLYKQGNTKILVGVTLQAGVPPFLKGQRTGWLTAEYSMLPHATHQRIQRESSSVQKNARSVEISRLIGRCLRPTINLSGLGERTIYIDCDVLQADGGTRVAAITAASFALKIATQRWLASKKIDTNIYKDEIIGLSVGVHNGTLLVDLNFEEDSSADADFNVVVTRDKRVVEIQGTCEKAPLSWEFFDKIKEAINTTTISIFDYLDTINIPLKTLSQNSNQDLYNQKKNIFSLGSRLPK